MGACRRFQLFLCLSTAFLTVLAGGLLHGETRSQTVSSHVREAGLPSAAQDLEGWHQGPVAYLLSGEEARAYRALQTDEKRLGFISRFWLSRDFVPATIQNENRAQFWERVVNANDLFSRGTAPGWKTDRGKFYIMLGPPDEIEAENMPNQRGIAMMQSSASGRKGSKHGADPASQGFYGLERWTYHDPPGDHLPANLILAFRLLSTGDYELSMNRRDAALFAGSDSEMLQGMAAAAPLHAGISYSAPPNVQEFLNSFNRIAFGLDMGRAGQVTDLDDLLVEAVTSEEFFGAVPFLVGEHFYKAEKGETLVALTLGIPRAELSRHAGSAEPDVFIAGRIESLDGSYVERLAGPGTVPAAPDNAGRKTMIYQATRLLAPGTYTATMGLVSRSGDLVGSSTRRITVPAFDSSLSLSSATLTRLFRPLESGARETAAPFRLGAAQIVPRLEPVYSPEEEFTLYYQVYGARSDPASGMPRLDITYRFSVLQESEFRPLGKPIQQRDSVGAIQAWGFALEGWPDGTYRLEVSVEDKVGRTQVNVEVPFSVKDRRT